MLELSSDGGEFSNAVATPWSGQEVIKQTPP